MKLGDHATGGALEYLASALPDPGAALPVADGVLWLRMPLPFALDHINLWALAEGDGWTLIDSGLATEATQALWNKLFAGPLAHRPVRRLIVTHCHPDHIGLASWLCSRFALRPWMTRVEFLHAHAVYHRVGGTSHAALRDWCRTHGLERDRLSALDEREDHYRRGVPALPEAVRCIGDGEQLVVGNASWKVIVGHGHSPGHASLYCAKLGVLIAGDMLLPRISTNVSVWPAEPEADPVGEFLASLAALETLPPDTLILPSHGQPFRGLAPRIAELRLHHRARLDALAALCAQPCTAADALPVLFRRTLDGHQVLFALGETIAHLNHLVRRGVLERECAGGVQRFVTRTAPAVATSAL